MKNKFYAVIVGIIILGIPVYYIYIVPEMMSHRKKDNFVKDSEGNIYLLSKDYLDENYQLDTARLNKLKNK